MTVKQALAYKMDDLNNIQRQVTRLLKVQLNENRFSALCSFVYNLGQGTLAKSTLLKVINESPRSPGIRDEFMKYTKARDTKTKVLREPRGLVNQRKAEADLYFLN